MRRSRGRLEGLEGLLEASHEALTLPDGSRVLYTAPDALRTVGAAIRGEQSLLLARFLEAGTTQGLPGLCSALAESQARGGCPCG